MGAVRRRRIPIRARLAATAAGVFVLLVAGLLYFTRAEARARRRALNAGARPLVAERMRRVPEAAARASGACLPSRCGSDDDHVPERVRRVRRRSARDARRRVAFVTGCHDCGLLFSNPLPHARAARERSIRQEGEWAATRARADATRSAASARATRRRPKKVRQPRQARLPARGDAAPRARAVAARRCQGARLRLRRRQVPERAAGSRLGHLRHRAVRRPWRSCGITGSSRRRRTAASIWSILHHVLEHVTDPLDAAAAACRRASRRRHPVRRRAAARHAAAARRLPLLHQRPQSPGRPSPRRAFAGLLARAGFDDRRASRRAGARQAFTNGQPLRLRLLARAYVGAAAAAAGAAPRRRSPRWRVCTRRRTGSTGGAHRLPVRVRGALMDRNSWLSVPARRLWIAAGAIVARSPLHWST